MKLVHTPLAALHGVPVHVVFWLESWNVWESTPLLSIAGRCCQEQVGLLKEGGGFGGGSDAQGHTARIVYPQGQHYGVGLDCCSTNGALVPDGCLHSCGTQPLQQWQACLECGLESRRLALTSGFWRMLEDYEPGDGHLPG